MCGIFFCLNKNYSQYDKKDLNVIESGFHLLNNRGPDYSSFTVNENKIFGFKRLSINDLSIHGNQPFFFLQTIITIF